MFDYYYWFTLVTAALVAGESLILFTVMKITSNQNWNGYKNNSFTLTDILVSGVMLYFLFTRPTPPITFMIAVVVGFFSHGFRVGEILKGDKDRFFFNTPLALSNYIRMGAMLAVLVFAIMARSAG